MRRGLLCVLMTALLSACAAGGVSPEEELALAIREEYMAAEGCEAQVTIAADYGQRVYCFEGDARAKGQESSITLTAPETVAGITARVTGDGGALEYDGLILETGELGTQGLAPMSVFHVLLGQATGGFMTGCAMEKLGDERALRVTCALPEEDEEMQTVLWFDPDSHGLLAGEIWWDGMRVLGCVCKNFRLMQ